MHLFCLFEHSFILLFEFTFTICKNTKKSYFSLACSIAVPSLLSSFYLPYRKSCQDIKTLSATWTRPSTRCRTACGRSWSSWNTVKVQPLCKCTHEHSLKPARHQHRLMGSRFFCSGLYWWPVPSPYLSFTFLPQRVRWWSRWTSG